MSQMAVICDDLTGAMETGLQLAKTCIDVYVVIKKSFKVKENCGVYALVLDTESRNVSQKAAAEKLEAAIKITEEAGLRLVYKKVDSTLRGNLGQELETVLAETGLDMIVFCPALPFNGRTTKEGYHYLNGVKLEKSDLASDPFSPVTDSFIPDLIKKQTNVITGLINLDVVRKGPDSLEEALTALHNQDCAIAVVDAERDEDLEIISLALKRSHLKLLPCGSAGLFSKAVLTMDECNGHAGRSKVNHSDEKPVVVLSGSPAARTKEQIKAAAACGFEVIRFDIGNIKMDNVEQIAHKAIILLKEGKSIIIDGAGEGKGIIAEQYKGNNEVLFSDSKRLQDILSGIYKEILKSVEIAGTMIIGGDTLYNICLEMDVKAIKIIDEAEPFIPAGILIQDNDKEIRMVSKAGGFGSDDIIVKSIKYLRGERYEE